MGSYTPTDRAGPEFVPDKTRTAFLDIARGLAAVLVVYTHIYDVFIREHKGVQTPPTDAIDNAFVIPLKLDEQGIGAVSVPIFFVISGFVVTPIALRMGASRFGINRLFRIYPLLLFVVAISAVLIALGRGLLSTKPPDVTVLTFLSQASLWNFFDRPFGAWVAVAWTLAVEILFYAMLIAVLPLLRKRIWLAIAVELEFILILLITYRAFGDEYRAFVINMVYTLIPIMGQAIWAAWNRKIPAWLAGVFVTVAWLMFVWAEHLKVDPNYIPRPFPIAFAVLLFLVGLFAEPYLRQRRFWTELSERTYSIYLLHGSVAFPLMHWLFTKLPLWLTVLIAVVATAAAAEVSYRFVERPSHNLARRLSRRPKPEPEPEEDLEDDYEDDYEDEDYEDDIPTEKTPPVARPRPRPTPAEVKTEKITPVTRPTPDDEQPTRLTPAIRARRREQEPPGVPLRRRHEPTPEAPLRRPRRPEPEPAHNGRAATPDPDEQPIRPRRSSLNRPTSDTQREAAPPAINAHEPQTTNHPEPAANGRHPARGADRPDPSANGHHLGPDHDPDAQPRRNGRRPALDRTPRANLDGRRPAPDREPRPARNGIPPAQEPESARNSREPTHDDLLPGREPQPARNGRRTSAGEPAHEGRPPGQEPVRSERHADREDRPGPRVGEPARNAQLPGHEPESPRNGRRIDREPAPRPDHNGRLHPLDHDALPADRDSDPDLVSRRVGQGRRRLDREPADPHQWPGEQDERWPGERERNGARGGRRRAEDILNGAVRDGSGGRRRAEEPAASRQSSVAWPGEQEDPDDSGPGRHRSD